MCIRDRVKAKAALESVLEKQKFQSVEELLPFVVTEAALKKTEDQMCIRDRSSRESESFRNGITKICATKVSAGVSTGIGDHEEKYEGKEDADVGDEQFEINDDRSFDKMYEDMERGGLQPVLNDYIYV